MPAVEVTFVPNEYTVLPSNVWLAVRPLTVCVAVSPAAKLYADTKSVYASPTVVLGPFGAV